MIKKTILTIITLTSMMGFSQETSIHNPRLIDLKENNNITTRSNFKSKGSLKELLEKQLNLPKGNDLVFLSEKKDELGYTKRNFQQTYKGVKVEYAIIALHSNNGAPQTVSGEYYHINDLSVSPKLTAEQALEKAMYFTDAKSYLWETPKVAKEMNYSVNPELLIFPDIASTSKANLAYKLNIHATEPVSKGYVYVDAHSGAILFYEPAVNHVDTDNHSLKKTDITNKGARKQAAFIQNSQGTADTRYSGRKNINTTLTSNKDYILHNTTKGGGILTLDHSKLNEADQHFRDNDNNWTAAEYNNDNKDNAALDVHWGTEVVYDYWLSQHRRNSFDDNGAELKSYVHFTRNGQEIDNAHWDNNLKAMIYGDGNRRFDALVSLDIIAHELGHAITSSTTKLVYARESGALNEGFSDLWAAAVEYYNNGNVLNENVWIIGESLTNGGRGLRSMKNPKSFRHPTTYKGRHWIDVSENACRTPTSDNAPGGNDFCGVHTNSSLLNYWFYLLVDGGKGVNDFGIPYNLKGIGMVKSAKIAYRALTTYLTPNATYLNAKAATLRAVSDLYGNGSEEMKALLKAWETVGVDLAPANFCNITAKNAGEFPYINSVGMTFYNGREHLKKLEENSTFTQNGYTTFPNKETFVLRNRSYGITVGYNYKTSPAIVALYDFNRDNVFSLDEQTRRSVFNFDNKHSLLISIPANANLGRVPFRFIVSDKNIVNFCGEIESGEIEDHVVNILPEDFCETAAPFDSNRRYRNGEHYRIGKDVFIVSNNNAVKIIECTSILENSPSLRVSNTQNNLEEVSDNLLIFPNPVENGVLYFENPSKETIDYSVLNINGSIMLKGRTKGSINIDKLRTGFYILKINRKSKELSKQFIVK